MLTDEERKRRARERWHRLKGRWASTSKERQAERERQRGRNRWSVYAAWRKANPSIVKIHRKRQDANRYGRKKATQVGPVDFEAILAAADGRCGICAEPLGDDVTFDHVVPLARGGSHTQGNLQAAHRRCNSRKGSRVSAA